MRWCQKGRGQASHVTPLPFLLQRRLNVEVQIKGGGDGSSKNRWSELETVGALGLLKERFILIRQLQTRPLAAGAAAGLLLPPSGRLAFVFI